MTDEELEKVTQLANKLMLDSKFPKIMYKPAILKYQVIFVCKAYDRERKGRRNKQTKEAI